MGLSRLVALLLLVPSIAFAQFRTDGLIKTDGLWKIKASTSWDASFGACTAGTDCFCDTISATYSNIIWCEDFDHDAFYATTPADVNDSYGRNNWVSTSGAIFGAGDRGGGSRWSKKYLDTDFGVTWRDGRPTTTCGSVITAVGGSGIGSGMMEWDKDDRWCANTYAPVVDIIHTSADFSAESGSVAPSIPGSGGAVVFGDNSLAHRNPVSGNAGSYHTESGTTFGGTKTRLAITSAIGYESNIVASNILGNAWKHDEFSADRDGSSNDALFGFRQTNSPANTFPIQGFIFGQSFTCSTALASATISIGSITCVGGNMIYHATAGSGAGLYTWPDDFDINEWHCMQAVWDFSTISSVSVSMKLDGEELLHATGINLTGSLYDGTTTDGVDGFRMNNYSNQEDVGGGINETTRRYTDNYVMRDSTTPVACRDIGILGYD